MSKALPPGYALPNTSLPKTTGVFNIVFASLLLLFVTFQIAATILSPTIVRFVQQTTGAVQAKADAARQERIDILKKQLDAAETDEEKDAIRGQLDVLKAQAARAPKVPDMQAMTEKLQTPAVKAVSWLDMSTSALLNTLMLISGIGLLKLKEGARRLALWVAGLKIARLTVLTLVQVFVIMPITLKVQREMFDQLAAGGGANANTAVMSMSMKAGAAAGTAMAFIGALFAMVWPIMMIVMLTRPGSRAACRAASYRHRPAATETL